ncbi:hypothetical protein H4582DRAFT_2132908 [Lactarius indigo]|nr:hypothetical protein H4582DRAFT_2132908 [Lactarius indigo]
MDPAAYANLSLYLFPYTNYASPTDDNEQGYRQFKGPINDAQEVKKASTGSFTTKKDVRMIDEEANCSTMLWPSEENIMQPYVLPLSLPTLANASMNIRWAQMKASLCNFDRDASPPEMCSYLSMLVMVWSPARHSRPNKVDHLDEYLCHSAAILDLDHYVNLATGSSADTPDALTRRHSTVPGRTTFSGVVTVALAHLRTRLAKKQVPDAGDITPRTPGIIPRPPCGGWYCAYALSKGPLVVSVSSCSDQESTWEDSQNKGKSMTTNLIKILKKNPSIKVGDLDQQLKRKLSKMAFKRVLNAKRAFKMFSAKLSPELRKKWEDEYTEKGLFQLKEQMAQIGSMHRLLI